MCGECEEGRERYREREIEDFGNIPVFSSIGEIFSLYFLITKLGSLHGWRLELGTDSIYSGF